MSNETYLELLEQRRCLRREVSPTLVLSIVQLFVSRILQKMVIHYLMVPTRVVETSWSGATNQGSNPGSHKKRPLTAYTCVVQASVFAAYTCAAQAGVRGLFSTLQYNAFGISLPLGRVILRMLTDMRVSSVLLDKPFENNHAPKCA